MKGLPVTGASIATPRLDEGALQRALSELGANEAFDDADTQELYMRIGTIHGAWLSEQEATQVEPVANALRSTARNALVAMPSSASIGTLCVPSRSLCKIGG